MDRPVTSLGSSYRALLLSLIVAGGFFALGSEPAQALTSNQIQQLQNQQKQLKAEAARKQAEAAQAAKDAAQLKSQAQSLNAQLADKQADVAQTKATIGEVTSTIADKQAAIEASQKDLDEQNRNKDELLRSLYETGGFDPTLAAITSSTVSELVDRQQYFSSIEESLELAIGEIKDKQAQLAQQQAALKEQQDALTALKAQQESDEAQIAATKATTLAEQAQAVAEQQQAADQAKALQAQVLAIESKLSVLTATARWGTDIISTGGSAGWAYNQLNYYTHLGSSPFTVHDYGCLVTSIAMVSTFYGHRVTPADIASHTGWFDRNGNAFVSTIVDSLGMTVTNQGPVDWDTVDAELARNHPVIVSVYLPQVGALNADGSSHFVVIEDKVGGQYLMEDPLGGGRGYAFGQVRSMKVLRP